MSRHQHVYPIIHRCLERHELQFLQFFIRFVYHRQTSMRVSGRIAMTREVLSCSCDIVLLHALHHRYAQTRYPLRVTGNGTQADDRIVRVIVRIKYRRKVDIDAQCAQLTADDLTGETRILLTVGGTDRHIARQRCSASQTIDDAAFLIDRDQQRNVAVASFIGDRRILHIRRQLQRLFCFFNVFRKQDDTAEIILIDDFCHFVVEHGHVRLRVFALSLPLTEIRHDHLTDLLVDRHAGQDLIHAGCRLCMHGSHGHRNAH